MSDAKDQYREVVAEHRDKDVENITFEVLYEFTSVYKDARGADRGGLIQSRHAGALGVVLGEVARSFGEEDVILSAIEEWASNQTSQLSIKEDKLINDAACKVEQFKREQEAEQAASDGPPVLDYGMGLDEYIEQHLVRVLKLDNLDAVSEPAFVFEFDDGARVEFDELEQRNPRLFSDKISTAVKIDANVVEDRASKKCVERISGDPSDEKHAEELYRKMSWGPISRPWGLSFNEVIADLEGEAEEVESPTAGPNSEAWENLTNKLRSLRASKDKQNVVDIGVDAVYYNQKYDEFWVPTELVDNAIGELGTTRTKLVYELDARGVTSDELSGSSCSFADSGVNPPTRFWRLKASHDQVPNLTVVDEIEESTAFDFDDTSGSGTASFSAGGDD